MEEQSPEVPRVEDPPQHLYHVSLNPEKENTIVLLHGILSSHLEWSLVVPYLSDYHILIPDLCRHSASKAFQSASISDSSALVADLILNFAHNQRAHVVGMSMGGYVALDLAQRYQDERPGMVESVFATGSTPLGGMRKFMASRPVLMWLMLKLLLHWLPNGVYWYAASVSGLMRHDELLEEMRSNLNWETLRDVYASIVQYTGDDIANLRVRTLVVAGGGQDDVPATKKMGELLKTRSHQAEAQSADDSGAVVVKNAVHAWDLQFPELFAQGIQAWVEQRTLPEKFAAL